METGSVDSDKALGVSMAFGVLAVLGALLMFGGPTQLMKAWGFAAALLTAALSVAVIHLYE
ncbi:DUF7525 family protein [Halohasta litorea]|uniref:Uncharacterized protein n=1 Tax=Halohasta litorea TaxID=869891 RepID=A0ABD6DB30_9EURY|nr:hypothetical protein [Halohasta litorea]MEA1931690.1 hypothetical protein [Euryarchaeota archaeon]